MKFFSKLKASGQNKQLVLFVSVKQHHRPTLNNTNIMAGATTVVWSLIPIIHRG